MKFKKNFDYLGVLVGVVLGLLIGYLLGTKLEMKEHNDDEETMTNEKVEYVYLLQIAKFDNSTGALNYKKALDNKELENIIVCDNIYYYIYGGIGPSEESLSELKNKYYILGYETIVKKELLLDKTNSIIDDSSLYAFYTECIHNLYLSLNNEAFTISEKYYIDPINIELFSQLTILMTVKNVLLKQKAQLQAYQIIIESLS